MKIICISGKKTAGKSTLANALEEGIGRCHIWPIAEPIKRCLDVLLTRFARPASKEDPVIGGVSSRQIMQTLGESMRRLDPDFWLHIWWRELENLTWQNPIIIVDDLRYKNEFDFFRGKGAYMIRLTRNWSESTDSHPSEREMEEIPNEDFHCVVPEYILEAGAEMRNMTPKETVDFVWPGVKEYLNVP